MKIAFTSDVAVFLEDGRILSVNKDVTWRVEGGKVVLAIKGLPRGRPAELATANVQMCYQASLAKLIVE